MYLKCSSVGVNSQTVGRANISSAGFTVMVAIQMTGTIASSVHPSAMQV
jgi:hypothetical protein